MAEKYTIRGAETRTTDTIWCTTCLPCEANRTRIVKRSPMRDHGLAHFKKMLSNQAGLKIARSVNRVTIAAPRGIPRNTATLLATTEYDIEISSLEWLMTLINRRASGAKRTICSRELMATSIAQYSLSPPASPVHMRT